jgi:hypothetical protein
MLWRISVDTQRERFDTMFNFPSNGGLPGFRVGRPDDVPGFNMNQDGSVGRFAGGPSNAPGDNALQTTALRTGFGSAGTIAPEPSGVVPANCTSAGGMLSCTTPRGRTLRPVPAPEGFPDVAPDKPQYHSYSVPSVLRGAPGPQAMQGVIDNPTPGPRLLTHPATPQGTLNEATPPLDYYAFLGATRSPYGAPLNPVKSYVTQDQDGNPVVMNVTEPGHALYPGYIARYVTPSDEGSTIQNEGEGLGYYQAPERPKWMRDMINNVWQEQSDAIIRRALEQGRRP